MGIKRHIPNAITCLNLLSGALAIVYTLHEGDMQMATMLILLAAIFDFFDGLVARALGVSSPIGKDLDSLADVISFGLAPAILILYTLLTSGFSLIQAAPVLLIAAFAALRLARFNHDTRQTTDFIGLPVPAGALFWIGIQAILPDVSLLLEPELLLGLLYALVAGLCFLAVSELPMFSFKLGGPKGRTYYQIALMATAIVSVSLVGLFGCAVTIMAYVLLSSLQAYATHHEA